MNAKGSVISYSCLSNNRITVEISGFEPLTFAVQKQYSTS